MPRQRPKQSHRLTVIKDAASVSFEEPKKCINEGKDVQFFLSSTAYTDIMTFLLQLNAAMFPRVTDEGNPRNSGDSSPTVAGLKTLLAKLDALVDEAPPDPGPRRFGNVAFKKWYALLEEQCNEILSTHLPDCITSLRNWNEPQASPLLELKAYLLGSFGSAQRLDYGSGHELSFLAFLGCIWKLGGFESDHPEREERQIVLEVVAPYLDLARRLIKTYNLEPAGSHGVWGLDDHAFIPYIFGSAQLSPAITDAQHIPPEGSMSGAPDPGDVMKARVVNEWRDRNLYFGAVGFINDVKKGPFWEHSPMLFDISGVKAGWAKINKGMIKMYVAEVLSKFPVVQHFPFGTMFKWERDPNAALPATEADNAATRGNTNYPASTAPPPLSSASTSAPWASGTNASSRQMPASTQAPWASQRLPSRDVSGSTVITARAPPLRDPLQDSMNNNASHGGLSQGNGVTTKAPWAT